jgi:hypothetical protein
MRAASAFQARWPSARRRPESTTRRARRDPRENVDGVVLAGVDDREGDPEGLQRLRAEEPLRQPVLADDEQADDGQAACSEGTAATRLYEPAASFRSATESRPRS